MAASGNIFTATVFKDQLKTITVPGSQEVVMAGERKFELLKQAFDGIKEILVVGYKSQGPAHANNLRASAKEARLDTVVRVALRDPSDSRTEAEKDGFTAANGTLVTPEAGIPNADLVIMLIADGALAIEGERLIGLMKPGAILGLAHGFYLGYLEQLGKQIRSDIGVIGVCPKGMGPSVRRLYEQGSGINCSFAVEQGDQERMTNVVLGWALGIGAPYTFRTTLGNEWRSDVVGERAILLGGVHGIVEALYGWKTEHGIAPDTAYIETVESLVGPISRAISEAGLLGVYGSLDAVGKEQFAAAYNAAYPQLYTLTHKIYRDVSSGREIAEVVQDNQDNVPLTIVDGSTMWRVGEKVRAAKQTTDIIDPTVAGVYAAGMIAQADVFHKHGHYWSEIVNESIIEAVDSLNPYMRAKGVAFMVDNCSITARRGSRKWAPQFEAWIKQGVLPVIDGVRPSTGDAPFKQFLTHDVHKALAVFSAMRPGLDISPVIEA